MPLVGRDVELRRLYEDLRAVGEGDVRLVHIIGEAGVGKSRLVREFRGRVEARFEQATARCASFEVDTPYALLARALRALLQIAAGVSEAWARTRIERCSKLSTPAPTD